MKYPLKMTRTAHGLKAAELPQSLQEVAEFLVIVQDERLLNEYVTLIHRVQDGRSQQETCGLNGLVAKIKKHKTVVINQHFNTSCEIETNEFLNIINTFLEWN